MPSARYRSLQLNVARLEKRFLPRKLTGPFTDREHDLARGFRLLAHAEIEAYLEDRAKDVAQASVRQFKVDRKPKTVVWCLVAFQLVQNELDEKYFREHYGGRNDHIDSVITKAYNRFDYLIRHNHGIREVNVLNLLLPIGFTPGEIDNTWLSTVDSFGSNRGETAHTSYKPTVLVDPATEKSTVLQILSGLVDIDAVFTRLK
jgi:hypothetical protein